MLKNDLDTHIAALVGPNFVEGWWNSPNKYWNGFTPHQIYERDEKGQKEVEEYIMRHCYGGW